VKALLDIMARLRDPESGCPWDRAQTFETIAPYTIEEAYEVAEAIAAGDHDELRAELGDLLFQVVFYARLAEEQGLFDFDAVVAGIRDKMIRRHPHVFADVQIGSVEEQHQAWEELKRAERREQSLQGLLDNVPQALPALMRAQKLQKRAAKAGFDWTERQGVIEGLPLPAHAPHLHPCRCKLQEELRELENAGQDPEALMEECGDLLFSCVNLIRHTGVDAEEALRRANRKFERRFRFIEASLQTQGRDFYEAGLQTLDRLWDEAKAHERAGISGGTKGEIKASDGSK